MLGVVALRFFYRLAGRALEPDRVAALTPPKIPRRLPPAQEKTVTGLIDDAGYLPIDLVGIDNCEVMEALRRRGAVYGEEYRRADATAGRRASRPTAETRQMPALPRPAPHAPGPWLEPPRLAV